MKRSSVATVLLSGLCVLPLMSKSFAQHVAGDQIEPKAGSWKTWVIVGRELRVAPPPNDAATAAEIGELKSLASRRDATAKDLIAYWNVGPPSYRWHEIALSEVIRNNLSWNFAMRHFALLHVAIYDGLVAAWDSKYEYSRKRPSEFDGTLTTEMPNPRSPSYPAEHAVAAGAAAEVLSYIFPDRASDFAAKAEEAGRSRMLAGIQYPSDISAGLELGRRVAARVIDRGKTDGSDAKWTGSVPTGPGKWKTFQRTPKTNAAANFWEYAAGGLRAHHYWSGQIGRLILEHRLDDNPPLAARAYALQNITSLDAGIACWDSKYAYWAIRPFQLDPDVKPLFPTPNHPSYPAAHGCLSISTAAILGYLFPGDATPLAAIAQEANESRIWAGIHYRSDTVAGAALGRSVANKVIDVARKDGSQ
jgi:membrane-associated phospholipid phosphatase